MTQSASRVPASTASSSAPKKGLAESSSVRVLAVASGGGHWVQLLRMRPAWDGCDVAYATTHSDYEKEVRDAGSAATSKPRFHCFPDANRHQKLRLVYQLLMVALIIIKERPDVVISTGASAGYFALRIAKYLGRRTIWVDSIANAEELSLAGKRVERFADLWLTQWPELARASFAGLDVFFSDERCVEPTDPRSNYGLAVRSLRGLPISFPGTTGAPRPLTGGKVDLP